jgi:hypothetical protein
MWPRGCTPCWQVYTNKTRGADNHTLEKKLLSRNLKKQKASEEGQGPHRAVEPMMTMMIMMMLFPLLRLITQESVLQY